MKTNNPLLAFIKSSIGRKILVALTGLLFIGFLAGHVVGNLLIFVGPHAMNEYAAFLHHFMHGGFIWVFRATMLAALVIHVWATISLTMENRSARKNYEKKNTIKATLNSRIMALSGLTILSFIIYHLLHFTVRVGNDYASYIDQHHLHETEHERHDAYRMVIEGFTWWPATAFYIIAITLLCSHLLHGFSSAFQTLGLRSRKTEGVLNLLGKLYTAFIWLGFLSIPVAVVLGWVE